MRQRGRTDRATARKEPTFCTHTLEPLVTEQIPRSSFADRHIGPDRLELARILDVVGVESLEQLAARAVPESILDHSVDGVADGLVAHAVQLQGGRPRDDIACLVLVAD